MQHGIKHRCVVHEVSLFEMLESLHGTQYCLGHFGEGRNMLAYWNLWLTVPRVLEFLVL